MSRPRRLFPQKSKIHEAKNATHLFTSLQYTTRRAPDISISIATLPKSSFHPISSTMPRVHCISRKWLKQRNYQACLRQAERMAKEVSLLSGKNNGAVTISAAYPPLSAPLPSFEDTAPPLDNSIDLVRLEPSGRQHSASSKKRRSARHNSHDDGNNSSVVTPRDKSMASTNIDDPESLISDSPVKNTRKRKLRSGASLAISEAISVGIVPLICKCQAMIYTGCKPTLNHWLLKLSL
eukprot:scaffold26487_cov69-Skeletonema_marinoi.AAC.1